MDSLANRRDRMEAKSLIQRLLLLTSLSTVALIAYRQRSIVNLFKIDTSTDNDIIYLCFFSFITIHIHLFQKDTLAMLKIK